MFFPFIDIHTHQVNTDENTLSVHNINIAQGENWSGATPYCSAGIHPWHIQQATLTQQLFQLENYCKKQQIIAVGEIGLDKMIDVPLPLQISVLEQQIDIAVQYNKPIIIHCVRAFSEFIAMKKRLKPVVPFIIHGFNKNQMVANELLAADCYLSLGAALLQPQRNAAKIIKDIPLDRLFLETDTQKHISIQQIYTQAAEYLAMDMPLLQQKIYENFNKIHS